MSKIQRIKNQAIANMSHTDMGLVIKEEHYAG